MRKSICMLCFVLTSVKSFSQDFSQDIVPSFDNSTIKLDCRIFNGDYSQTSDYLDVLATSGIDMVYNPDTDDFEPLKGNIKNIYVVRPEGVGRLADSLVTVFASLGKTANNVGGGIVFFKMKRRSDTHNWEIIPNGVSNAGDDTFIRKVSFAKVGGTVNNNNFNFIGTVSNTTHRFLVTEDVSEIKSNKDLIGFADTSDYTFTSSETQAGNKRSVIPSGKKVKRYQAMGWPIEIDAVTGEVVTKIHRLGRGVTAITQNNGGFVFAVGKNPAVLFSYNAPNGNSLNTDSYMDFPAIGDAAVGGDGAPALSAYVVNPDGSFGDPVNVALKVDTVLDANEDKVAKYSLIFDSLLVARDRALMAGATMFANITDIRFASDGTMFITENGVEDSNDWYNNPSIVFNGKLAPHLSHLDSLDGIVDRHFSDPFGRVLAINNIAGGAGKFTTFLSGNVSNGGKFFSNPYKTELFEFFNTKTSKKELIFTVKENITDITLGRNPNTVTSYDKRINESYYVKMTTFGSTYFRKLNGKLTTAIVNGTSTKLDLLFNTCRLYASSSNGSVISSSNDLLSSSGSFISNYGDSNTDYDYDTYLTVVNGYEGTDKSMIVAVRNIFPNNTDQCLTGLGNEEGINKDNLLLWPNPSTGLLNANEVSNYSVMDLSGVVLMSFKDTNVLNIAGLDSGIYFVKNAKGIVRKIVVE